MGGNNLDLRADAVEWAIEQIKPDHKGDNTMLSNTEILKARGYRFQECGGGCEGHVKTIGQAMITIGDAMGDGEAVDDLTSHFGASVDTGDGQMGSTEGDDLVLVIERVERIALETVREAAQRT